MFVLEITYRLSIKDDERHEFNSAHALMSFAYKFLLMPDVEKVILSTQPAVVPDLEIPKGDD